MLGANDDGYADGTAKVGAWSSGGSGGTWSDSDPASLDGFFNIYVGGDTGLIDGVTIGEDGGDAWAHTVNGSIMEEDLYCQGGTGNNKPCDTSRPDPVEQPMPISDGNIAAWKVDAEAGGVHEGDLHVGPWPNQEMELGPQKIEGNLTVNSGGTLTVTGTLWVEGNVTVNGGGTVRVSSSLGDTVGAIIADGRVIANGGGHFEDNGIEGNYILVVTTSTCPVGSCGGNKPALEASGGAEAVIFNAQNGTMELSGGADLNQATAERIIMSGGAEIFYESGLVDLNFSSGPSGGWAINSWGEI
jgi:hypothetical protein